MKWKFYVSPNKRLLQQMVGYDDFYIAYDWLIFNHKAGRYFKKIKKASTRAIKDKLYFANEDFSIIERLE